MEIRLLQYLMHVIHCPNAEEQIRLLNRERVYKEITKNSTFNQARFSRIQHAALLQLRKFIHQRTLSAKDVELDAAVLAEFFMERGAFQIAQLYIAQLQRWLQREREEVYSHENLQRQVAAWRALSRFSLYTSDKNAAIFLHQAITCVERQYLFQKADLLLSLLNLSYQRQMPLEEDPEALCRAFLESENSFFLSTPLGQMYAAALQTMLASAASQKQAFDTLTKLYEEHFTRLGKEEREHFEPIIFNFCVRHFGEPKYREYLLHLYQRQVDQLKNARAGAIHANKFISLVRLGIYAKDIDFVQRLVEQCRQNIYGEEDSLSYYSLAKAHLYFEKRKYREVLYLLQQLSFGEPEYQYLLRMLELRTLYEMGEDRLFEGRLHAFRVALTREKDLSRDRKEALKRFHQYLSALWRYRDRAKIQPLRDTSRLRARLQKGRIPEEAWFQEKLKELEQGPKQR